MKKDFRILLATICVALSLTSCHVNDDITSCGGKMSFTAGARQMLTRAQYSDVVGNVARIDWQVGDNISIYCGEALTNTQADYAVRSVTEDKESSISKAVISCIKEEEALSWGKINVTHDIYAVFPSPATSLYESDVFSKGKVTGYIFESQKMLSVNKIATDEYEAKPDLRSQYMVARTTMKPADDKPIFLEFNPLTTAIEFEIQNDYSTSDPMNIAYIQLVSKNHKLNGLFSVDLTSWTPKDGLPATTSAGLAEGTPKVMLDFRSQEGGCLSLKRGEKLKFTFFLLPNEDIDDLAFMVVDPDGGYVATELAYSNDPTHGNAGVNFPRCKKSFVKGLLVPEGVRWTVSFTSDLSSWNKQDGGTLSFSNPEFQPINFVSSWVDGYDEYVEMDGMYNYDIDLTYSKEDMKNATYKGATFENAINVTSYKQNEDVGRRGAEWRIQIYDPVNLKWVNADIDTAKNPKGTRWLSLNRVSGSAEGHIQVKVDKGHPYNTDEVMYEYSSIADHNAILRGRDEKGTEANPWDLSKYDIYGNLNKNGVETANCYVINSAGWYAFPLVYGNAITKGADFPVSYNPSYSSAGMRYLTKFQNTKGSSVTVELVSGKGLLNVTTNFNTAQITSPYIETDIGRYEKHYNLFGQLEHDYSAYCRVGASNTYDSRPVTNQWTAFPIWQDTDSRIVTDDATNCYVISATEAANRGLALGGTCGYVVFHVNKSNLQQGNFLIGVKHNYKRDHKTMGVTVTDEQWNRYVWSWHIWVTDESLNTVKVDNGQGTMSDVMPINLGWVDGGQTIKASYKPLEVKLRIAQPRGNEPEWHSEDIVIKRGSHQLSVISPGGSSPYYQWGRPTPMPRLKDLSLSSYRNISGLLMHSGCNMEVQDVLNYATSIAAGATTTSIGTALNNPTVFYGTPTITVGVLFTIEVYGQWFCEPYGSVGGVMLAEGYVPSNLWNAQCTSGATATLPTVKTVYDPCPPGFCVPNGDSFGGIRPAEDGSTFEEHKGRNFFTSPAEDETIFFPAIGSIDRGFITKLTASGDMWRVGTEGDYWLSSGGASGIFSIASQNDSHSIHIGTDNTNGAIQQSARANGFCVRPQVIVDWIK